MSMIRRLVCVLAFVAGAVLLTANRHAVADQGCNEVDPDTGEPVGCACPDTYPSEAEKTCASDKITCGDDSGFELSCKKDDRHYTVASFPKECLSKQTGKKCSEIDTPCVRVAACEYDTAEKKCKVLDIGIVVSKANKPEGAACKTK